MSLPSNEARAAFQATSAVATELKDYEREQARLVREMAFKLINVETDLRKTLAQATLDIIAKPAYEEYLAIHDPAAAKLMQALARAQTTRESALAAAAQAGANQEAAEKSALAVFESERAAAQAEYSQVLQEAFSIYRGKISEPVRVYKATMDAIQAWHFKKRAEAGQAWKDTCERVRVAHQAMTDERTAVWNSYLSTPPYQKG